MKKIFHWKKKRVLVTGAGGFIGSHLVEALIERGANVTALIRYNSRNDHGKLHELPADTVRNIDIRSGDIQDAGLMDRLVKGQDTVFHLAALIAIPYSYEAPQSFVAANVLGTLNILQACQRHTVRRLVHTSTSEVYGTARYTPMDESHPLQAQSPYAASKIGADKLVESYWRAFGLPVVTVRPFNTYGPRQSVRAIIPTIITQCLATGSALKLGRQDPVRDFTFVKDTANAFLCAAESDRAIGEVVNVGTGSGCRVEEIVQRIFKLTGETRDVVVERSRLRPDMSEVFRLVCCARKARRVIGWRPKVSFEHGLQQTIEYFEQHMPKSSASNYVI